MERRLHHGVLGCDAGMLIERRRVCLLHRRLGGGTDAVRFVVCRHHIGHFELRSLWHGLRARGQRRRHGCKWGL